MHCISYSQGRSQYEANRGTCLSHLRFDPGSVLFQRSHQKDLEYLGWEFNHEYCLSPYFFLATALSIVIKIPLLTYGTVYILTSGIPLCTAITTGVLKLKITPINENYVVVGWL